MALLTISLILLLCNNFNVILGNTCNGGVADTICETGPCDGEYVDRTGGNYYWWACGVDCPGGKYWTDGYCNCACVDRQQCENECKHNRGPCYEGYEDVTDGNFEYWACGVDCPGGKYYTDGVCNCACQDKPDKCPDGVVCGTQGPCEPGYMDKTQGNYNWWACGANCQGGQYYTDATCGCACVNAGQCSITPSYHSFNFYRSFPQFAFIRTIGPIGDYLAVTFIISLLLISTLCCYKKRKSMSLFNKKSNKYKVVSLGDDSSASEAENIPINK